jgi:hypothetical protein
VPAIDTVDELRRGDADGAVHILDRLGVRPQVIVGMLEGGPDEPPRRLGLDVHADRAPDRLAIAELATTGDEAFSS